MKKINNSKSETVQILVQVNCILSCKGDNVHPKKFPIFKTPLYLMKDAEFGFLTVLIVYLLTRYVRFD